MSTLQIEERISVSAPPARVWKFILDPARVAACLPGAKLDGAEGDRTFLGTMKVKVGPVLMEFKGKATMSEVVPDERRVTLTGTGNDKSGGGSARMDMKSQILARDGGGSEIVVIADVDLAGKLVRFGRGMMEGISKQLFKQFSERVRAELESEEEEEEEEQQEQPAEEPPAPTQVSRELAPEPAEPVAAASATVDNQHPSAEEPRVEPAAIEAAAPPGTEPPGAQGPVAPPAEEAPETIVSRSEEAATLRDAPRTEESPSPTEPASVLAGATAPTPEAPRATEGATPEASAPATSAITPAPKKKKPSSKKAPLAPVDDAPLDAGSLVWAAIWAWFKGLFGRLFGKKS